MKTFALTAAAVLGLMVFSLQSASAGGIYFSSGGYGHNHGGYYGNSYYGGNGGWGNRTARRGHYDYHDTSHYDYVPTQVVPHWNHYHVIPGGYQFHQQGHYDYHRGNHHHH